MALRDKSNGYEEIAPIYISGRGQAHGGIGATVVARWSQTLPAGAAVLDLGCGPGVPISEALIDRGFKLYGIDASASMVAAFRNRFPEAPVECAAVEDSEFFGRQFDAVIAWGLFFLLEPEIQRALIAKIGAVLPSGGKMLFTSPEEICSWPDAMTGQMSVSLGLDEYRRLLDLSGMVLIGTEVGAGNNHYYFAQKK